MADQRPLSSLLTDARGHRPERRLSGTSCQVLAQKEKLHAELKRVLQQKGAGQPSSEGLEEEWQAAVAVAGMESELHNTEKTPEKAEFLEVIVETKAAAGASGVDVAGGGKQGLFVKDVLKGSPAARTLSLREGDQLLSARVYFDNMKYEDAVAILRSAEPYKVSFCLKRTVPGTDVAGSPEDPTLEARGPKAKVAKLSIQSLTSLKKSPKKAGKGLAKDLQEAGGHSSQEPLRSKSEVAPVDVEFSLPKFSKLRKARSAGEVAVARPSPDISPLLSSLESKRRKLKLPRLKVKEALAGRAVGRLDVAPPKVPSQEQKAAVQESAGKKSSWFSAPFSKGKKPKEEAGGLQALQLELDFPVPRGESPEAGADHQGTAVPVLPFGLPKVEMVLPKGSPVGPDGAPAEGSPAGLKLSVAEVAAPELDMALCFPRLEGTVPAVGFQPGAPASGAEKEPAPLDVLGKGRGKAKGLEEKAPVPSLEVAPPPVDVVIPLPRGKAEVGPLRPKPETPEVSIKVPTVSLPKLGTKPQEGGEERRVPHGTLPAGKRESPEAKAKSRIGALGISLTELKLESKEAAVGPAESKRQLPALKVPALHISAPKVTAVQLPKALSGLAIPAKEVEDREAAEGPKLKLQMPQVSLPTCHIPAKAMPSLPPAAKGPGEDAGGKAAIPTLELSVPAVKSLAVQLPTGLVVPKPELGLCVDQPQVDVALPTARLSFPSAVAPVLELDLPKVGVELDLPKVDSEGRGSSHPCRDQEAKSKMPVLESLSKGLEVEISVPPCTGDRPERQPGVEASAGRDVGAVVVARIPQVSLASGKEEAAELALVHQRAPAPEGSAPSGEVKLPSVEVTAMKFPGVTKERAKSPETEAKPKPSKFALPKFSISSPKVWKASPESFGAQAEAPGAADKGLKLKLPKFGISFPKSKWGADAEGPRPALEGERRTAKERELVSAAGKEHSGALSVAVPRVGVEVPQLPTVTGLPTGKAESSDEDGSSPWPSLGVELPGINLKGPKFSLPRFGGEDVEGSVAFEAEEAQPSRSREALTGERGPKARAKVSKFKMPLFGTGHRDVEWVGSDLERKAKERAESPKGKPRGLLGKMPKLKLLSAKAELGQVQVPRVELPTISLPEAKAEEALPVRSESPRLQAKVPLLEIAVPGTATKAEPTLRRPGVEASGADTGHHEGELRIPTAPSLGVSAPQVELHLSLPSTGAEAPRASGVPGPDVRIRLPQVGLPTFERAEGQLLGRAEEPGTVEASMIQVPRVEFSMPKVELPWAEGEQATARPEGGPRMPSVELPALSPLKVNAPEQERQRGLEGGKKMQPTLKLSSPAIRLAQLQGSSLDGEGDREVGCPQLELKVPHLGGSAERPGPEVVGKGGRDSVPCPSGSFGLCKAEEEAGATEEVATVGPGSKFKLKIPSLSISKSGLEPRADMQPLCPPLREEGASFTMPPIALPTVGFSVAQDGKRQDNVEAGKPARGEGLEAEEFEAVLQMPQIKVPALEVSVPKGAKDTAPTQDPGGRKAAFTVPSLELSAPTLHAHAEYKVEQSQGLEAAGKRVRPDSKSPGGKGEASDAEAGRKYRVKIPKFGLSLPTAGEGIPGQEAESKARRPALVLGRPKGKASEGSSGLLEGDEETDGRGFASRLKLGLSLSKLKTGSVVNGEVEISPFKTKKLPKLGFSSGEGAEAELQEGAQDGKSTMGKIRLPQVELSSPSPAAGSDPELSLKLVRPDEAASKGTGASVAPKFKPPQITFSGFKKRNGEEAPGVVVSSTARTEMASLERGDAALKGEKPPKFKFPKVSLSAKTPGMLDSLSKGQGRPGEAKQGPPQGLKVPLPSVGFSEGTEGVTPTSVGEGAAAV